MRKNYSSANKLLTPAFALSPPIPFKGLDPPSIMIPRSLWHMTSGLLRRKIAKPESGALYLYPTVWRSRARLKDCNLGNNLTENAYLRQMELAIWYACGSMGLLHACARNRWHFVFGSQAIRVFQDIPASHRFEVHSRVVFWDDVWQYLVAQFKSPKSGQIYAEGLSRVMLRQGRERVNPRALHADIGLVGMPDQEDIPESIQQFLQWDAITEQSMKRTAEALACIHQAETEGEIPSSNIQMAKP